MESHQEEKEGANFPQHSLCIEGIHSLSCAGLELSSVYRVITGMAKSLDFVWTK